MEKWLKLEQQRLLTKEEISDFLSGSSLPDDIRMSLEDVTEREEPWYIYESLREAEFLPAVVKALEDCRYL